jgi:hypothetical protein
VVTECLVGTPADVSWAVQQDGARQPVALYGVLLLAAAWFVAISRGDAGWAVGA